jgi:hypothetical protein
MLKHAKYFKFTPKDAPAPQHMASWFPRVRKWPEDHLNEDRPLKVYFMNECVSSWQCSVNPGEVMKYLEGSWSKCFTIGDNPEDSPIRVLYEGIMVDN